MSDELAIAVKRALMDAVSDISGWIKLGEHQRESSYAYPVPSESGIETSKRIKQQCLDAINAIAKAQQAARG
jgi:hypothetical protein